VVDLDTLRARGVAGVSALKPEDFEVSRGKVGPPLRAPPRSLGPLTTSTSCARRAIRTRWPRKRARLQARVASLERRLAAALPVASLDEAGLKQRAVALERESEGASKRLAAVAAAATSPRGGAPGGGRVRLRGVDAAAAGEVDRLRQSAPRADPDPRR